MKKPSSFVLILVLIILSLSCSTNSTNPEALIAAKTELINARAIIDSLRQKVAELEEVNLLLKSNNVKHAVSLASQEEAAVHKMVNNLKTAFNNLNMERSPDKILQYFLPSFSTNQVTINIDNEAEIALFSAEDFKSYLKKQMKAKGTLVVMSNITFLDTRIKGEIFTTTYKNQAKVFKDKTLINNRAIVTTITGRNQGGWKIGNYSWVSIDYPLNN